MPYYASEVVQDIEEAANFFYIDREMCRGWNTNRRGGELRLLTGWTWAQRDGNKQYRTGFKTRSAAMRDAYYVLTQHREQPAELTQGKVVTLDTRKRRAVPRLVAAAGA